MLIVLFLLGLTAFLLFLAFKEGDYEAVGLCITLSFLISLLFIIIPLLVSWDSAVEIDTMQESLLAEYRSAITLYEDKAVINLDQAVTDFKYQGYQEQMAGMIKDLRGLVAEHNTSLIGKRKYNASIVFSWLIIMPDNDRLIHIQDH